MKGKEMRKAPRWLVGGILAAALLLPACHDGAEPSNVDLAERCLLQHAEEVEREARAVVETYRTSAGELRAPLDFAESASLTCSRSGREPLVRDVGHQDARDQAS